MTHKQGVQRVLRKTAAARRKVHLQIGVAVEVKKELEVRKDKKMRKNVGDDNKEKTAT